MILDALRIAYLDLATLATSLDEDASWRPTACVGWSVRDLIHHLLSDAQRALVALATPARGPADKDAATYWLDSPGASDAESRGIRATRTMASQWPLKYLTAVFAETTSAVVTLSERAAPSDLVSTQGHVLSVADLLATLVVEASIHHLDMTVEPDCAGPGPEPTASRAAHWTSCWESRHRRNGLTNSGCGRRQAAANSLQGNESSSARTLPACPCCTKPKDRLTGGLVCRYPEVPTPGCGAANMHLSRDGEAFPGCGPPASRHPVTQPARTASGQVDFSASWQPVPIMHAIGG